MIQVTAAAASDPGLRRESNEDAYVARPDLGLFVVADGMGGHAAGEVASRLAIEAIEAFINETRDADLNRTWPFPYDTTLSLEGNRLKGAFLLANRRVAKAIEDDLALRGMATTAAAILIGRTPSIAHVGDSRVYLMRGGALRQMTDDHSWVGEQVRAGVLSSDDARQHPWRNVVTRAIAGGEDPNADVASVALEANDRLLICSDGLTTVVQPAQIGQILGADLDGPGRCRELIAAANEAGGPDNITVIVIDVDRAGAGHVA